MFVLGDKIRSAVEMQLKASFERCDQLKQELEDFKGESAQHLQSAKQREDEKQNKIQELQNVISTLQADLAAADHREDKSQPLMHIQDLL